MTGLNPSYFRRALKRDTQCKDETSDWCLNPCCSGSALRNGPTAEKFTI